MNRTLGKVLMIICSLVSSYLFIYLGFSIKNADFAKLLTIGLLAAFFLVIGLSVAHFLRGGQPTSLYSLNKKQVYELIAMAETINYGLNYEFLYILKNSRGDIFSIISDEQCVISAHKFTCPVSVKIHALESSGKYVLLVCDQPVAEIPVKTPA